MTKKTQNSMWGGRFADGPDAILAAINASIGFDKRLYAQDIEGSRAHAAMLAAQGIITSNRTTWPALTLKTDEPGNRYNLFFSS